MITFKSARILALTAVTLVGMAHTRALNAQLRVESDSLGLTFLITLPPEVQSMAVAAS